MIKRFFSSYLIAFGLENGKILFYTWNLSEGFVKFAQVEDRLNYFLYW